MFYLMRHAEAGWGAKTDSDRELTNKGKQAAKSITTANIQTLLGIEKIVCSPYVRTKQTAQLMADLINQAKPENLPMIKVLIEPDLTPENSVTSAVSAIEKHWCDNLLIVTHQPLIGNLISFFEQGECMFGVSVSPSSIYAFTMAWPGPGCGLREFLFSE